jgi:hypothetical protein
VSAQLKPGKKGLKSDGLIAFLPPSSQSPTHYRAIQFPLNIDIKNSNLVNSQFLEHSP